MPNGTVVRWAVVVGVCCAASLLSAWGGPSPARAHPSPAGLVELQGELLAVDLEHERLVLDTGHARVTLGANADTTVFSAGDTATILGLAPGQRVRAFLAPGRNVALWLEPEPPPGTSALQARWSTDAPVGLAPSAPTH